ncbi:MAG: cytochrome [Actinomycetia bacterium]|nr:cytochrome [Actinomycetes bacterium]
MTADEAAIAELYDNFDAGAMFAGSVAGDVRNPYPELARRRRESPVEKRTQTLFKGDAADGSGDVTQEAYFVYTYDDVNTIMRDNESFTSEAVRELMGMVMGPYVMVGLDEPEHKRHRNLVAQAFRQRALQRWDSELVLPIANELIDRIVARRDGKAELVRDFTYRLPVQVIAGILGLPPADYPKFHQWALDLINVTSDPEAGLAASASLAGYFSEICALRRREPQDDVISDLVNVEIDGETLDEEEILSFCRLLLPAGAETTYRATGNFLYGLLSNPDQMAALKADPALMTGAIEESIRWEPPLLIVSRRASRDVELSGVTIPAGADVVPNTGSACHDETRWGDTSEDFDILRTPQPHIAFGAGPHMCLGIHLARMEMRASMDQLLTRLPNLRFDPDRLDTDPHIHGETFRSPTGLPVVFDA